MPIQTLRIFFAKLPGKLPLRTLLIVAFVGQLLVAVGLTGWLSFRNGQLAVSDLATQLRREITSRVYQHLKTYLAIPHLVNQVNADAIHLGLLNLDQVRTLDHYFWKQIQTFHSVNYIALATTPGEYIGTKIREDGSIIVEVQDNLTAGHLETWETDNQGNYLKRSNTKPDYDPRQRPWYQAAVKAGKPVWTDIYVYFSGLSTAISANQPIYDKQGKLLAVASADLTLFEISKFLSQLAVGQTGQTFILERSGSLVATSTQEKPYRYTGQMQKAEQFKAIDSEDPLTRATATYLLQRFGALSQIQHSEQLDFVSQGQRHFLQIVPFQDEWGLDWLIVVVIPENDFMAHIYAYSHATLIFWLITLSLAILLGILTAQWIVQPLHCLQEAAQQLSNGQWEQLLPTHRTDEIGTLAKSFKQMVDQLKTSFTTLEANNIQLRDNERKLIQFLEAMPVGVFVFDSQGCPYYANSMAVSLIGQGVVSNTIPGQFSVVYQAYLAGTHHLYPSHRLPNVRALWGDSSTVDDIEIHRPDKILPLEMWGTPIVGEPGKINYAIVAFQDITERKQAEANQLRVTQELAELNQQLEEYSRTLEQKVFERTAALEKANQELQGLARTDGLTQIANRRHFDEHLQLEWNVLRREKLPLSLILCDIDYFKRYNDTYGHQAGDECLRQVAQALYESVRRPADLAARYGGEEFAVIMPNTPAAGAIHIATVIQKHIQQLKIPHAQSTVSEYVTMSFGVSSVVPHLPMLPEALINMADNALYEAKKQGRNSIVLKSGDNE